MEMWEEKGEKYLQVREGMGRTKDEQMRGPQRGRYMIQRSSYLFKHTYFHSCKTEKEG